MVALDRAFKKVGLRRTKAWTLGDGLIRGASNKKQVLGSTKKLGKSVLALFHPLSRYICKRRLLAALSRWEDRPSGHDLWVLAQKS